MDDVVDRGFLSASGLSLLISWLVVPWFKGTLRGFLAGLGIPDGQQILLKQVESMFEFLGSIVDHFLLELLFFLIYFFRIRVDLLFVETEILLGDGVIEILQNYFQAINDVLANDFHFLHVILQMVLLDVGQLDMFLTELHQIVQVVFLHLLQHSDELVVEALGHVELSFIVLFNCCEISKLLLVFCMHAV